MITRKHTVPETSSRAPGTTFLQISDEVPVREGMETAVDLAHLREHTKELMSALPNHGPMGKF